MGSYDLHAVPGRWTWKASLDVALFTLLLNITLSFVLTALLQNVSGSLNQPILGTPLGTSFLGAAEAVFLIPLYLYSKRFEVSRLQLGVHVANWRQGLTDVACGFLFGLAMVPVSVSLSTLNELILGPQPGGEYIRRSFSVASPLELALLLSVIAFAVAPVEEVISRGFIQQGFERGFGKLKGLVLASFLF